MKRLIVALIAILAILMIENNSYTLECYFSIHISDRYYDRIFNDPSYGRFRYITTISEELVRDTLDIWLKFDSLSKIQILDNNFIVPERIDFYIASTYSIGDFSVDIGGTLYGGTTNLIGEVFSGAYYYISPFDLVLIVPEFTLRSDFRGIYYSMGIKTSFTLPTNPMISFKLGTLGIGYTEGYYSLSPGGIGGIILSSRISIYFDKVDISTEGGYFLSINGNNKSYPYAKIELGIEFSPE